MEEFRPVVDYEDIYEISNLGNMRSIDRMSSGGRFGPYFISGKPISTPIDNNGYRHMTLARGKHKRKVNTHRLVARAFLGEPNGLVVDHLNGDRSDNRAENLEYVTMRVNVLRGKKGEIRPDKKCVSRGVTVNPWNRYIASIRIKGKGHYLGSFDTELEASVAYDKAFEVVEREYK
tara:strand:+ start:512 stop:1039 length:528 start_codon:yes stop_codon:yes gene_type:complete